MEDAEGSSSAAWKTPKGLPPQHGRRRKGFLRSMQDPEGHIASVWSVVAGSIRTEQVPLAVPHVPQIPSGPLLTAHFPLPLTVEAVKVQPVIRQVKAVTGQWLFEDFRTEACTSILSLHNRQPQALRGTDLPARKMRTLHPRQQDCPRPFRYTA